MEQKDFREILRRYQSGRASDEEARTVEKWYEEMGKQKSDHFGANETKLEEQYLKTIMEHVDKGHTHRLRTPPGRIYFIGIAASVLLVITSLFIITAETSVRKEPVSSEPQMISWKHIANGKKIAQRYTLPDGSSITLEPYSNIKFSSLFNVFVREVHLEGGGFFEVTKSKDKPFLVVANEVTAKVLGTSFTVRAFRQDQKVTVAVKTGRVSVCTKPSEAPDKTEEIVLTPNQEIVYDKTEKVVARRIVETPEPIISVEEMERMRFEEAPLKEIFEAIEKIYGVDIEYDEEQFASCMLTTSVSSGGLYNRMDIITSALGAEYELNENKIVVKGTGCN